MEKTLSEMKGKPFTFKFDETTTAQTKQQYDAYGTYYSHNFGRIVTVYLGTIFVGRCTADDLLNDFNVIIEKLDLDEDFIIS